ncbi:MAG: winged helix-turn-helix domain-containing protein [Kiritimatiellia bacterium]
MSNETPAPEANLQPAEKRTPFNEVSVLFPLLSIYTAGYMGLMAADFLLKHSLSLPEGLLPVYIALLGAYAADKEIRRWLGNPEPPRKGSLFVYLWILFALLAFTLCSFRPDYPLPDKLVTVCLQVLGIFFGSKTSKYVCERRSEPDEADPGREKIVLDLIASNGQASRRDVVEKLNVSERTASRLLQSMETNGLILHKGEGRGIYYILP